MLTGTGSADFTWWLACFLLIVAGCRNDQPANSTLPAKVVASQSERTSSENLGIRFQDRTESSLVDFQYRNDEEHSDFAILESLGGGVAVFDFDVDGKPDLLFPGGGRFGREGPVGNRSALYRSLGEWSFVDCTHPSQIGPSAHYSHGASTADFDEDGFDDVLITGYGGLTLYRNQGDGSFRDVSAESQLDDRLWSSSAAWGDFNGDSCLDLYVVHYVDWSAANHPYCGGPAGKGRDVCPPKQFNGLPHVIYFGNGDGTFRDATSESGLQPAGKGLGVVVADLDLDGDLEIYVTNDTAANLLFRNDGQGQFADVSALSGTAVSDRGSPDGSMGTDVGDFNLDGLPDLWVANYERENFALYRNQGHDLFRHVSQSAGIAAVGGMYVGWGTRFLDADLDGDEDLIVANGHVIRFPQHSPLLQQPLMLENVEGARYVDVSKNAGTYMTTPHAGRGLATGDLDGDGDEDVVSSNMNQRVALLSNESTPRRNWLGVRIIGRGSCRSAIGAVAIAKVGDRSMLRQIRGGSSFASTSDSRLHFGLGNATRVDSLTIRWISGGAIELKNLDCNQFVTIIEPPAGVQ